VLAGGGVQATKAKAMQGRNPRQATVDLELGMSGISVIVWWSRTRAPYPWGDRLVKPAASNRCVSAVPSAASNHSGHACEALALAIVSLPRVYALPVLSRGGTTPMVFRQSNRPRFNCAHLQLSHICNAIRLAASRVVAGAYA
jgi:hypothetical protein